MVPICLVPFGSRIEGEIQRSIAIHRQQQSEGRETEAESEAGGSGKSKRQAPESLDSGGRKGSELGECRVGWGISGAGTDGKGPAVLGGHLPFPGTTGPEN